MTPDQIAAASDPWTNPGDPFPEPAETPNSPEYPQDDPINVPQPGPDVIDPSPEPLNIPPGTQPEIPPMQEPPGLF